MPSTAKQSHKNSLDIRLAENVVFLRAGDATGRPRAIQADAPPGMLRGLLTLNLVKPTKISSIEIELVGKTSTAWPEGIGARRIDITEEHEIYSQTYVLYRAGLSAHSSRRTLSVGPGISLDHEDEEHSDRSSEQHGDRSRTPSRVDEERRGRAHGPPPSLLNRNLARRHLSVDQTNFQRDFVAHRENHALHPPSPHSMVYSPDGFPPHTSFSSRMHTLQESPPRSTDGSDSRFLPLDSPGADGIGSPTRLPGSSNSSIRHHDGNYSARPSFDDERPEFLQGSSNGRPPSSTRSRSRFGLDRPRDPSHSSDHIDHADEGRGRKGKRFSLGNVSSMLLDVVRDNLRSRSPMVERLRESTPPRGRAPSTTPDVEGQDLVPSSRKGTIRSPNAVGEAVGDGWKEFKKGVYTYPISFAVPANSPPTLSCDYGNVSWELKAYAHRPGAFTTKLSALQPISIVATPGEDDTEETESIIVERQWETQMQYLITISGRSFPIGGTMPVSITFMPWTKMKVYRISVLLEEKVDYWTNFKRIVRSDPLTRVSLLSLKSGHKEGLPILPLNAEDPNALLTSPFIEVVNPVMDLGEYASSLMGPGPWTIQKDLQIPRDVPLHFTNKNRRSNMSVSHTLKIVFRVERGDNEAMDPQTGKRKMFDIVVQTPIHILSFLCNPEHLSLPPYSRVYDWPPSVPPNRHIDGSHSSSHPGTIRSPTRSPLIHADSGYSAHSSLSNDSLAHALYTPPPFEADSIYERTNQFERLVAGHESEIGEAPPAYEDIVNGARA